MYDESAIVPSKEWTLVPMVLIRRKRVSYRDCISANKQEISGVRSHRNAKILSPDQKIHIMD